MKREKPPPCLIEHNQNKKLKEIKFTSFVFWEALLDPPPCPPGHAGQMISCKIMFSNVTDIS
jgi:hypothetical protein